jgi:hypothetical protein
MNAPLMLETTPGPVHFGPPRLEGQAPRLTLKGSNPACVARLMALGWRPDPEPEQGPDVTLMSPDALYRRRREVAMQLTAPTVPSAPVAPRSPAAPNPTGELELMSVNAVYARRAQLAAASRAQHEGPRVELTANPTP